MKMMKPTSIPKPVFDSVMAFARNKKNPPTEYSTLIKELRWDGMNGNYYFWRSGMYHGVELDGHIHT